MVLLEAIKEKAERDLNLALENAENPNEKFFIENDINFLNRIKNISRNPFNKSCALYLYSII